MIRGLQYFAVWTLTTAAAIGVSWLGIRFVLDAGAPERPRVVAGPTGETTLAEPTPTSTSLSPPPSSSSSPEPSAPTAAPTTTTTAPAQEPPAQQPTSQPPAPSEEGAWVERDGKQVFIKSFRLQGGVATVSFAERDIQPVSATPRQGYAAVVEQPADAVVVVFTGNGHTSKLEAMWVGKPQWRIIESD
ncbi:MULTISPECIES: hypothetical protein [Actinosynnema]|uniref:hypothetical protein n=1 Tax=Actinosynnema TaxID=40566 RepID=UPI0020A3DD1B|nr:hypothetical protein [Actinosynnema pretiosum]MCP2099436.1 hypothetical protein [Actinosynnema pretiosum]